MAWIVLETSRDGEKWIKSGNRRQILKDSWKESAGFQADCGLGGRWSWAVMQGWEGCVGLQEITGVWGEDDGFSEDVLDTGGRCPRANRP